MKKRKFLLLILAGTGWTLDRVVEYVTKRVSQFVGDSRSITEFVVRQVKLIYLRRGGHGFIDINKIPGSGYVVTYGVPNTSNEVVYFMNEGLA